MFDYYTYIHSGRVTIYPPHPTLGNEVDICSGIYVGINSGYAYPISEDTLECFSPTVTEEEFLEFLDQETDRDIKGDKIYQGLKIMEKYIDPEKHDLIGHSEHDHIWFVDIKDLVKGGITKEDVIQLGELGFMEDEDSLCHFT